MAEENHDEFDDLDRPPSFFHEYDPEESEREFDPGEPVECRVEAVFATQTGEQIQRYVMLNDGSRKLMILIGAFEASAITYPLENHKPDRPMTHDLIANIIEKLDAKVDRIVIDDLWGGTYYAKIYLKCRSGEITIDSRPSDAIAIAVRTDGKIFVAEGILDNHTLD